MTAKPSKPTRIWHIPESAENPQPQEKHTKTEYLLYEHRSIVDLFQVSDRAKALKLVTRVETSGEGNKMSLLSLAAGLAAVGALSVIAYRWWQRASSDDDDDVEVSNMRDAYAY